MKYHYIEGVIEKDKKGHPKLWLTFFACFLIGAYGAFLVAILSLNGWPIDPVDKAAKTVKLTKPGHRDVLYIPVLNIAAAIDGSSLQKSGNPAASVVVQGAKLAFGVTPDAIRTASPFFNLSELKTGDEVFLDSGGTRYAYKITSDQNSDHSLILKTSGKKLVAKQIGTVTWDGKTPRVETL